MKKILLFAAVLLLGVGSVFADSTTPNYFYVGENGVLRISPNKLGSSDDVIVKVHLIGRIDTWNITVTYPNDLLPTSVTKLSGMSAIPYLDSNGLECTYNADLTDYGYTVLSSTISIFGYWDPQGDHTFEPYGTVKWEAGDHEMFRINLNVNSDCTGDTIAINGTVASGPDWRAGTTFGPACSKTIVRVAYKLGDVNGDESVNIVDANDLINYLSTGNPQLNSYQFAAADINGDGLVNTTDVMLLINILSGTNNLAGMDNIDDPIASIMGSGGTLPME
jgi:hypothetical protein